VVLLTACLALGFRYRPRFSNPIMPLALLTLFAFLRIEPGGVRLLARCSLLACAVLAVGATAIYTPPYARDPLDGATAVIRSAWDRQFACGPAYVLGDYERYATAQAPTAYGIGMTFGRSVIGLSSGDLRAAPWVDGQRLRDLGAILVETPYSEKNSTALPAFSTATPPVTATLPYRRSFRDPEFVLAYRFVPPTHCPG
jgi:hypothetical protein